MVLQKLIPESSSGRTKDSGSFNGGSNPSSGAKKEMSMTSPFLGSPSPVGEGLGVRINSNIERLCKSNIRVQFIAAK